MAPFIWLFSSAPLSALQVCQVLTLVVETVGTVFFYRLLHKKTENVLLALCGAFLFQTCYWRYSAYTYYLQLWYPYIILYGVYFAAVFSKSAYRKLTDIMWGAKKILTEISFGAICLLCICSLVRVLPSYRCQLLSQKQRQSWRHAYDILDSCSEEGEILVSMLLSNYCIERGIATSNYGQAEYNNLQNLENYKSSKLWRNLFLFDHTEAVLQKNIAYNQSRVSYLRRRRIGDR